MNTNRVCPTFHLFDSQIIYGERYALFVTNQYQKQNFWANQEVHVLYPSIQAIYQARKMDFYFRCRN